MTSEATCADPAREQLLWYLNGSLEGAEAAAVAAHIETCTICAADLRELSSIAAAIDHHGMPEKGGERKSALPAPGRLSMERPAGGGRFWIAATLAASLLLPAVLGIYWAALGFPTGGEPGSGSDEGAEAPTAPPEQPEPPPRPSLESAVTLDLGAGPARGTEGPTELALPPGTTTVLMTFRPPLGEGGPGQLALRDAAETTLARLESAPAVDRSGRAACSVPASLLEQLGDYSLVWIVSGAEGPREYAYPFRIVRR